MLLFRSSISAVLNSERNANKVQRNEYIDSVSSEVQKLTVNDDM